MKLKEFRKSKKITQEKLAQLLGVSRTTVTMWERGASQPDNDTLLAISRILEISVDELLGNKKRLTPEEVSQMPEAQLLKEAMEGMSPEQRQQLVQYARFLVAEDKAGNLTKGER